MEKKEDRMDEMFITTFGHSRRLNSFPYRVQCQISTFTYKMGIFKGYSQIRWGETFNISG